MSGISAMDNNKFPEALPEQYLNKISKLKEQYEKKLAKAKRNDVNIGAYSERFGELEKIIRKLIDDKNKVRKRIERRDADIWDIAHAIQLARYDQKYVRQAQQDFESLRTAKDSAREKFRHFQNSVEKLLNMSWADFRKKFSINDLISNPESGLGELIEALAIYDGKKNIKKRLSHSKTRPVEKALTNCCMDLMKCLSNKKTKDSLYQLIADIINLFDMTPHKQTANTIRQRILQASKKPTE
jgi:hypothetical protein